MNYIDKLKNLGYFFFFKFGDFFFYNNKIFRKGFWKIDKIFKYLYRNI